MKKYLIFFLVCMTSTLYAMTAPETELKIALSDVTPFAYIENGELKGIHIDFFRQLEKESGLNFNFLMYPHARLVLALEEESPDLLIIFRPTCDKFHDYEIQGKKLYTSKPSIFLKKNGDHSKANLRIGKLIGTCTELVSSYVKKEFAFDVSSMDQAVEMLRSDRLDGICGLPTVINYSINKNKAFKKKLAVYKSVIDSNKYDAVICRKKNLNPDIKRKLEEGLKRIKILDIH